MTWKKENGLHTAFRNGQAVATISAEFRQPMNSKGKYFKAYYANRQQDFQKLSEAKKSVEQYFYFE